MPESGIIFFNFLSESFYFSKIKKISFYQKYKKITAVLRSFNKDSKESALFFLLNAFIFLSIFLLLKFKNIMIFT